MTEPSPAPVAPRASAEVTVLTAAQMRDLGTRLAGLLHHQGMGGAHIVVGSLGTTTQGHPTHNAAVLHQGKVVHIYDQVTVTSGSRSAGGHRAVTFQSHGAKFGLAVGQDLHQPAGVVADLAGQNLDALLVLSGSPFAQGKTGSWHRGAQAQAMQLAAPVAVANLVGGQDGQVFDGGSFVVAPDGTVVSRAGQFHEELILWEVGELSPKPPVAVPELEELYHAIVLGLTDYARKNGFTKAILGLSGGLDSALVAAMAVDALGAGNVTGVAMPSAYSTEHSLDDAAEQAKRLGLDFRTVPIQAMVDQFHSRLDLTGIAAENIQSRVRGAVLMAVSNMEGHLVLATGNKSELAVGYSTIYGDAVGGFAPIKDVLKSEVKDLANWRNHFAAEQGETEPIPGHSITKPPSAELRPNQRDTDSLPAYELLDPVLELIYTDSTDRAGLVAAGHNPDVVDLALRLVDKSEWKRRQYPLGPKVTALGFGRDRHLPTTNHWQE